MRTLTTTNSFEEASKIRAYLYIYKIEAAINIEVQPDDNWDVFCVDVPAKDINAAIQYMEEY